MEKSVSYSTKDWDDVPDVPLLHVSYLIHILLPRRHFGHDRLLIKKTQKILERLSYVKEFIPDKLHIVPVGSKLEGCGIPVAVRLTDEPYIEYMSDFDVMLVRDEFSTLTKEFEKDGTKMSVFIETAQTHPGYGRVRFASTVKHGTNMTNNTLIHHGGQSDEYYLNFSAIMREQADMMATHTNDGLNYNQHGPAITADDPVPMTLERLKTTKLIYPLDCIFAIPCNSWPECAIPWIKRKRTNDWL
ncbi:uncharacterized protein LOC134696783 isoform X2 [Mytilus trossulus]|uniref:uncharacterized protein LOC134696783 isoform X2 n=1 Tax=Mytilus trossulus TaxID=6551 RepID=UPI0030060D2D